MTKETDFKIESGIPMPRRYPFARMQVGDSFAVPSDIARTTITVAAARYGKNLGMKFTVRKDMNGALRCWRME